MSASVLVTYATRYGSTQKAAEAIAAALREHGLAVDVQPVREVNTIEGYRTVVLGAPLYMFHWHKDALRFLTRHRAALSTRPVAIFVLGSIHNEEKEYQGAREQLDKELAKFLWLIPTAIAIFGGKFDPQVLTFPYNLIPALKKMPASDVRDWVAIRAWADDLATQFQPALA
jgi:menaquinone-dependent protoporphyrinogen oxidase